MSTSSTAASTSPIDCFSCKLIGSSVFGLLGVYSIAMARHYSMNKAISAGPGAIWGIRLVGYGFIAAAAARWVAPMRASKDTVQP